INVTAKTWVSAGELIVLVDSDDDDSDSGSTAVFDVRHAPDEGLFRVRENGDLEQAGTVRTGGAAFDLAEFFPAHEAIEPGELVAAAGDPSDPARVRRTVAAMEKAVIGVVTTNPGLVLGGGFADERHFPALCREEDEARRAGDAARMRAIRAELDERVAALPRVAVALRGRVPVKVTAEAGPIAPGDRLTPASTPGHAMRFVPGLGPARGVVVGKALQAHASGTGTVLMLIDPM
ncbi:MAG: hypothetical protein ACF8XB_08235, partial [Planctomycetota bacterium JB042]